MKKTIKRTAAIVLTMATTASVAGVCGATTQNIYSKNSTSLSAYAEDAKNYLSISNYQKSVSLYSEFTMPTAKFVESTSSEVTLTDYTITTPSGDVMTKADITDNKFKVTDIGKYTIAYEYNGYKGEVYFNSEKSDFKISLDQNNNKILPSKVSVKNKDGSAFSNPINIPSYKIYNAEGKLLTADELEDVIIEKTCINPSYQKQEIVNDQIVFNTTAIQEGFYILTYNVYKKNSTGDKGDFLASITTQFEAVSAEYKNEYELKLAYASDKPSQVNVGKSVDLPAITGKNEDESVPVYYTVEVYKNGNATPIDPEETINSASTTKIIAFDAETNNYVFTADQKDAYYTVKYTAFDALGNTATTSFIIDEVTDNIKPEPIVVDAYEVDNVSTLKNKDYALKSIFGENDDVVIKAIYAEDLGTFNYNDFKFERRIESSSREVLYTSTALEDAKKEIVFNAQDPSVYEGQEDKYIVVDSSKNLKNGTYYVYYKVTDANNNEKSISYKFVIDDKFNWDETIPTVSFNDTFYSNVDKNEKIEFSNITAKDDKDDRLETKVYYSYLDSSNQEITDYKNIELTLNDDNKFVIDTSNAPADAVAVQIFAEAKNDGGKTNDVNADSKIIKINSEKSGVSMPTVVSVTEISQSLVQGNEIKIPTVVFEDKNDGASSMNATITVKCTTADNNVITYDARNAMTIKTGDLFTISNASFMAATAGNYQISIKVTDAEKNTVIQFINYTIAPVSYTGALRFDNLGITDTTLELGKTFKLQAANIIGDDSNLYDYAVRCIEGPTDYELSNSEFTPSKVGEYKLQYVMYEKANISNIKTEEIVEFTITVEDKTKPVINVNWESNLINDIQSDLSPILPAYAEGTKILIPKFSASDLSGIDQEKSTIVISSNKTTQTIKFSEMNAEYNKDGKLNYLFNYNAEYTITYTAVDTQGNSQNLIKTIKIGDLVPPTLIVDDAIAKQEYKIGQTITIDLADTKNYISVTDNADTELTKADLSVKLYVGGTEVQKDDVSTDSKYTFTIKDSGSYELKFIAKDSAGYETVVTKSFEVKAKAKDVMTSTETIGSILIVASVVVLAGVVVYFVISKKKMDKLYK